jgi:hypothetical protein
MARQSSTVCRPRKRPSRLTIHRKARMRSLSVATTWWAPAPLERRRISRMCRRRLPLRKSWWFRNLDGPTWCLGRTPGRNSGRFYLTESTHRRIRPHVTLEKTISKLGPTSHSFPTSTRLVPQGTGRFSFPCPTWDVKTPIGTARVAGKCPGVATPVNFTPAKAGKYRKQRVDHRSRFKPGCLRRRRIAGCWPNL